VRYLDARSTTAGYYLGSQLAVPLVDQADQADRLTELDDEEAQRTPDWGAGDFLKRAWLRRWNQRHSRWTKRFRTLPSAINPSFLFIIFPDSKVDTSSSKSPLPKTNQVILRESLVDQSRQTSLFLPLLRIARPSRNDPLVDATPPKVRRNAGETVYPWAFLLSACCLEVISQELGHRHYHLLCQIWPSYFSFDVLRAATKPRLPHSSVASVPSHTWQCSRQSHLILPI
jgi:hypothetical protein